MRWLMFKLVQDVGTQHDAVEVHDAIEELTEQNELLKEVCQRH